MILGSWATLTNFYLDKQFSAVQVMPIFQYYNYCGSTVRILGNIDH